MINFTSLKRLAGLTLTAAGFMLAVGTTSETNAQRDPFAKPSFMRVRKPVTPSTTKPKPVTPVVPYGPPTVEARIEYSKRLREAAIANGTPIPKVTSVLTLNEMAVTGIFKTPRGYAAMVEAMPIKLSYTIYPGEKFFDGQLVAVDENRLVFRKVTKVGEGKFVSSVENKALKSYSAKAQVEGTAPAAPPVEVASTPGVKPRNPFLSPVDEMNQQPEQPATPEKDKPKKGAKKPVKVAKNNDQ